MRMIRIMYDRNIKKMWKLTLPTGNKDSPSEILPPKLASYSDAHYYMKDGVQVFIGPTDGVHTRNTKYCRCEYRELDGNKLASWDFSTGYHTMIFEGSCDHLPKTKPQVVMGQIHDSEDDVLEIRISGSNLEVMHNTTIYGTFTTAYVLGTMVEFKIVAHDKTVDVTALGKTVSFKPATTMGCYFKLGCYTQSSAEKGDPHDYGQTSIKSVSVSHSTTPPSTTPTPIPSTTPIPIPSTTKCKCYIL